MSWRTPEPYQLAGLERGTATTTSTTTGTTSAWPAGTRLICRRERPHPGAQLSLFDTVEGFRHQCVLTDQPDPDIAALELRQRQRGRAESVIRDAKACGLANLPFDDVVSNDTWCRLAAAAVNL